MNSHIPIGFRFEPTDEELLRGFLYPLVIGSPLPWNGIVHKTLYGPTAAPWQVFGDCMEGYWETKKEGGATKSTTYVFTDLVRVHDSKRISRTAGGGTWGGQTGPKKILHSDTGETIGHMRMLSFEHPDSGGASSEFGHWIMHEYVLSDKVLKEIAKPGAGDMVVCRITKCVKNSGVKRRRTPPQPQFFPPAVVDVQENGCMRAAEESRVQEVQETTRCIDNSGGDHQQPPPLPQPQFFPPAAVVDVQVTGRKRAAEESLVQEVHETVCKKQKSCGGGFTEVEVIDLEADENIEISSGGNDGSGLTEAAEISEAEKEADSWLVSDLEEAANVELSYGGFSDMAAFAEAVAQSDLWQATATATPLGFDDFDDNFDVGLLW